MTDQAELLRKRREARQKKILASGESRLSKITGTSGNAQVAPSPTVLMAREQLLRKEQEDERRKVHLSVTDASGQSPAMSRTASVRSGIEEEEELAMPGSPLRHNTADTLSMRRTPSYNSTSSGVASVTTTPGTTPAVATESSNQSETNTPVAQDPHDADPDDSLGAPAPESTSRHQPTSSSGFGTGHSTLSQQQQNMFMNNPFLSPEHHNVLTRTRSSSQSESSTFNQSLKQQQQQQGAGNLPPGFTVITPQEDVWARWWKLLHFVLSAMLGVGVVYQEYRRQGDFGRFDALATAKPLPYGVFNVSPVPIFWYFITMELLLQSTRMYLHGLTTSPSSTLGTLAGFLPPPFSDAIRVFMRYRLIWSSLVNDLSVVVFVVGMTIVFVHMFS
ncbi:hypothetical protein BGW38_004006 [Lunasporangiospora selenospora]|uniref:Uncharacterized protein n=1 Tax=Lunasporangiospora selenospora TaxID=979761 RepID=A0A9P6G0N2_9FUNG|nr:hypothetical protein BGW38_004006 [Lunasporangiospora selenospora]